MKTYKGLDKDFKCRGLQYVVGGTQEIQEKPIRCGEKGFHSCENALDIFGYYDPANSRFAECEADGEVDKGTDDTKIATSKITIKAEINLFGIIKAGTEYILSKVNWKDSPATNTGNRSAAFWVRSKVRNTSFRNI